MEFINDFFNVLKFSFFGKVIQLASFLLIAFLIPNEFAISFFWITIVFVLRSFIKINYYENNAKNVKKYYNNAFFLVLLFSFVFSIFLVFFSFFLNEYFSEILRFTAIILFLSSFSIVPEAFFINRNDYEKIYNSRFISQIFFLITFPLIFLGYKIESVFYGFIFYFLAYGFLLYKKMPFTIKPVYEKLDKTIFGLPLFYQYLLLVSGFVFGYSVFGYVYIAYILGYFIYEAILEPMGYLKTYFKSIKNDDLLKLNFARIVEYINFIAVPYFIILIVFFEDFLKFFNYSLASYFILFAGFLSIAKITRLFYFTRMKFKLIRNLSMLEFIISLIFAPLLFLGSFGFFLWFFLVILAITCFDLIILKRILNLDLVSRDYFYTFFSGILSALFMALAKEYFILSMLNFLLIVFFGKVLYLILSFLFNKSLLKRLIRFLYQHSSEKYE